ncbi:hypothetical protein GRB29_09620 [Streptococcus pneumoniae]|nr:hypothetical protein [Streptococcus pneumoniae]
MEEKQKFLKNVYDDTSGWLKFVEAKLTAFLTFETGLFYFVAKLVTISNNKLCLLVTGIGIFLAILLIIIALLPQYNEDNTNPLYFMTWTSGQYRLAENYDFLNSEDYESQIRDLSKTVKRKMVFLKYSIILYTISILLFSIVAFL